ncbi:MAG: helix-turn-helix transcriptional regulator [Myxococcaceae bacterium]|jgi:transcriptional regulator with XRE-family HTH domain|nr:helix-turn-helix transcriptional regulator [Myxococcaceae bacterium]
MQRSQTKTKRMDASDGFGGFGQRLAALRKAAAFTQVEFAQQLGATQRMVTYWESEGGRPPGHLLPRIANVLSVSIEAPLGEERLSVRIGPAPSPSSTTTSAGCFFERFSLCLF